MDGLALLCNLFADGPVTLRRLRVAHLSSLPDLERAQPAQLAECLHASIPQARAFAEEARRLDRRLREESVRPAPLPRTALRSPAEAPPAPSAGPIPLRTGLVAGLDEALVARLGEHGVHTLQALTEFAGLALARRTGIPYSTLLELARRGRRVTAAPVRAAWTTPRVEPRSEHELVPFRPPRPAVPGRPGPEPGRTDEFTLPPFEPESAGPFG